jgi:CheY-like chemotaxis protein
MNPQSSVTEDHGSANIRTSKKILYVDDDQDWRDVVTAYLEDSGYELLTAKDATEARRLAEGVKLGLIILDLGLNGEDGLMLMNLFKRNQPDAPIILYTGLIHDDDVVLAMLRQGARQYVRKGPLEDLRQAVQAATQNVKLAAP